MAGPGTVLALAQAGAVVGPFLAAAVFWALRRSGFRKVAWAGLALFALVYGLGVWTFLIEPKRLVVRQVEVVATQWRGDALRIGVITDTHVGAPHTDAARIRKVVARMNGQAPDLVVLLGDYVGDLEPAAARTTAQRAEILRGMEAFRELKAPLGVIGVIGNHDVAYDEEGIARALTAAGVSVLDNTAVHVARPGGDFWVGGVADVRSRRKRPSTSQALALVPAGAPALMLTHWPDVWTSVPSSVALTLAGHSHCGQVNFPFVGRLVYASYGSKRWPCGLYREGDRQLHVTGGVGVSILPVRFRVPPEIAVVTLRAPNPALAPAKSAH